MGTTLAEAWRSWGALWVQTLIYGLAAAYLMGRRVTSNDPARP